MKLNDPLDKFKALTIAASRESKPVFDVTNRVLHTLHRESSPITSERVARVCLGFSACAALVSIAVVAAWSSTEPPLEMLLPFVSSLP